MRARKGDSEMKSTIKIREVAFSFKGTKDFVKQQLSKTNRIVIIEDCTYCPFYDRKERFCVNIHEPITNDSISVNCPLNMTWDDPTEL